MYEEAMSHFVIGLGEMHVMSDAHCALRAFDVANKKKCKKIICNTRCSIATARAVIFTGTTRLTIFLLK